MAKNKQNTQKGHGNIDMYRAFLGLRSSSAAEPHKDARTKRARTRGDALRRALKDYN